jgi:hypothetical protein
VTQSFAVPVHPVRGALIGCGYGSWQGIRLAGIPFQADSRRFDSWWGRVLDRLFRPEWNAVRLSVRNWNLG